MEKGQYAFLPWFRSSDFFQFRLQKLHQSLIGFSIQPSVLVVKTNSAQAWPLYWLNLECAFTEYFICWKRRRQSHINTIFFKTEAKFWLYQEISLNILIFHSIFCCCHFKEMNSLIFVIYFYCKVFSANLALMIHGLHQKVRTSILIPG